MRRLTSVVIVLSLVLLSWAPLPVSDYNPFKIKEAQAADGNMIVFYDGGTIPTDWTCISCTSGDDFFQKFPRGEATYGGNGGSPTSTHTATGAVNANTNTANESFGGTTFSDTSHTHTFSPTISATNTLPAYRNLKVIQYDFTLEPPSLPTGAIVMFDTSVPSGWTRYSAQDNSFIRGENDATGTGGSASHSHTISGTTGAAVSVTTEGNRGGGTQVAGATDGHTHTVSSSTDSSNHEPPYINVVLGKLDSSTTTIDVGLIAMWTDTPASGWTVQSTSTGPFYQNFLRGASTYGGTGGSATHSHTDETGIVSSGASGSNTNRTGSFTSPDTHTHNVDVTSFSTVSNLPPYTNVIVAKKTSDPANSLPTTSGVSIDSGAGSITLTEDTTTQVTCAATVTDNDGFADISSVTADLYRTPLGTSSALSNNDHYRLAGDSQCVPSGGSGNTETYTCDFDVQYYADPTDAGSTYAAQNWTCTMTPVDTTATGTEATDTIELNSLLALSITAGAPINYGSVNPDNDTGAANQTITVRNTGNVNMDPELSGLSLSNGAATIAVGQQEYSATTFTYGGGTNLTGTDVGVNLTLPQGTAGSVPVEDIIYWGIGIPSGTAPGTYTGTTTLTAAAAL